MKLTEYIEETKREKVITLYYDIETFQFNETEGYKKPTLFKNEVYIVGLAFEFNDVIYTDKFADFEEMFDTIDEAYKGRKTRPRVDLIAHNGNRYDNHYLRRALIKSYGLKVRNLWVNNVENNDINSGSVKVNGVSKADRQGLILEKRVKSSTNLEMTVFLRGQQFNTIDNYIKTNTSIAVLGQKLLSLDLITLKQTKMDYDYGKYNKAHDMSYERAKEYARDVYDNLTEDELTYVENDVIILAKSKKHYSELFKGFSYDKFTFTSNVLDVYNNNNLTSYQLLNKIQSNVKRSDRVVIRYTDYTIQGINLYDWMRPFYRGGLNLYNDRYLGRTVCDVFGMDLNSSYSYAMHNFKIPTFLKEYSEFKEPTDVEIELDHDTYTLYQITKEEFDNSIVNKIESVIVRQALVKYYSTNDTVNLNSYTFRMLIDTVGLRVDSIKALTTVTFETEYFGSRDKIDELYYIKTQGSNDNRIIYNSPYDITVTDEPNENKMTTEEVGIAKVNLNGLYGIPALRAFYAMTTTNPDGTLTNHTNGFRNSERNVLFSIFTTSVALWNLLRPMGYLTAREIDRNFLYADTDSLYFKKAIQHKIPSELFDPNVLGKWDLEHNHIKEYHILNHKKYAYVNEEGDIEVKSGGIPQDSYDLDMPFKDFIDTQFSDGVELENDSSVYTVEGTVAIYRSKTVQEVGKGYRITMYNPVMDKLKEVMIADIRKTLSAEEHADDLLYIESPFGTLSKADIYPYVNPVNIYADMFELKMKQDVIRRKLGM